MAYVKQRDFDRDFDLLDYDVITGHVSACQPPPFIIMTLRFTRVGIWPRTRAQRWRRAAHSETVGRLGFGHPRPMCRLKTLVRFFRQGLIFSDAAGRALRR